MSALALALLLVGSLGCTSTPQSQAPSEAAEAAAVRVSASAVAIEIPVPARPLWRWHLEETLENALEYEWQIYLGEPEAPQYTLGFLLFKHPHATPAEGTLPELIRAGQSQLSAVRDGQGTVQGVAVETEVVADRLVIRLENPVIVEELFGTRPPYVTLSVQGPGVPRHVEPVPVHYASK